MSAAWPDVSAVIPAYNAERWIGRAVASVLAQTYRPSEVIVVDDGSTDRTGQTVRAFGGSVTYLRQDNGGVSRARNHGARAARGEFVAFLDADDEWTPRKLETQVERVVARPATVACFMSSVFVDAATGAERPNPCRPQPDLVAGLLLYSCIVGNASSVLVKGDAFARLGGFDPDLSQCADWDMWIRLAELGPVEVVAEPLVRVRTHGANMSGDICLLERDTLRLLAKFFASPEHCARYGKIRREVYANQYLTLSGSYLQAGRVRDSLRCLVHAIGFAPGSALLRAVGTPARAARRLRERSTA